MCVDRKGAEMKNCPASHQKERRKRGQYKNIWNKITLSESTRTT
jgi:hypothetical protein